MAMLLLLSSSSKPTPNPNPEPPPPVGGKHKRGLCASAGRRELLLKSVAVSLTLTVVGLPHLDALADSSEAPPPSRKSVLPGITGTKSWFQYVGDGFSIRVPPLFEDIMEPEDYNAGLSLYGDKAKPKMFAARFASTDRSEVLSVVVRPSNQLKITFLEAKDITELGTLKEAAKIFVPARATLYSARTIKIKEDEGPRTYYYYEFSIGDQHIALVAAVNRGKVIIAGASAPQLKWEDDNVKLRSAAVSLSVL